MKIQFNSNLILFIYFFLSSISIHGQFSEIEMLLANDGMESDEYGFSVSMSGDIALVGAYRDDDNGSSSGSAYLYERDPSNADDWIFVKKIVPADNASSDNFGICVSVDNDIAAIVASEDDDNGFNSGSIYIFRKDEGGLDNWGQVTKVTANDQTSRLGLEIHLEGDLLIAGELYDGTFGLRSGAAYIFGKDVGGIDNWGQLKKLFASDPAQDDQFGHDVHINEDYAIVGSVFNDDNGVNSGSAYVYGRNQGGTNNWGVIKKLLPSDGSVLDNFGSSVSILGSLVAVGARTKSNTGQRGGAVYLFSKDEGGASNWGQINKLEPNTFSPSVRFGWSIDFGNGYLVVGAPQDDEAAGDSGAAYIFGQNQGGVDNWGFVQKIWASDGAFNDRFGQDVFMDGEMVIAGAHQKDTNGSNSGGAYIYNKPLTCTIDPIEVLLNSAGTISIDSMDLSISNFGSHDTVYITQDSFTCDDVLISPILDSLIGISGTDTTICTFEVTVRDSIPPLVTCLADTIYIGETGSISVNPLPLIDATDNCGVQGVSSTPSSFTCSDLGQQLLQVRVFDTSLNRDTCEVIVTVIDTISPIITCQDTMVDLPNDQMVQFDVTDLYIELSDNCSIDTSYASELMFSCLHVDSTISVLLMAVDESGNQAICTANVTISDSHGYCCPDNLTVIGSPIDSTDYFAADSICGSGTVDINTTVNFRSTVIKIAGEFEVADGGVFQAINENCND